MYQVLNLESPKKLSLFNNLNEKNYLLSCFWILILPHDNNLKSMTWTLLPSKNKSQMSSLNPCHQSMHGLICTHIYPHSTPHFSADPIFHGLSPPHTSLLYHPFVLLHKSFLRALSHVLVSSIWMLSTLVFDMWYTIVTLIFISLTAIEFNDFYVFLMVFALNPL